MARVPSSMYATLQRASCTGQRVAITDFERKQLLTLREELDRQFHEKHRDTQPASRSAIHMADKHHVTHAL